MKRARGAIFWLAPIVVFAGCGQKATIEGKVLDNFGKPLKDVEISIETTTFKTKMSATKLAKKMRAEQNNH